MDPVNREPGLYFAETLKPETRDPAGIARWLENFVATVAKGNGTAIIDPGGGDASLSKLVSGAPDCRSGGHSDPDFNDDEPKVVLSA